MPNNVNNRVTIAGPSKDINALVKLVNGLDAFDFDKVIPSPKELREVQSGFCNIDGRECQVWLHVDGKNVPIPDSTLAEWKKKYGATNWYDWDCKHWGTKWNAYNVQPVARIDKNTVEYIFDTAWSSPAPVIEALSARFPSLEITVEVSGEVDEEYTYCVKQGVVA